MCMKRLDELTKKAVALHEISSDSAIGFREYKLEKGAAISATIYQSEDVASAIGYITKGTEMPHHVHDVSKEIFIVYSGDISVITEKSTTRIKKGGVAEINPGEHHKVVAHENTKLLIITIPPDFDVVAKIQK